MTEIGRAGSTAGAGGGVGRVRGRPRPSSLEKLYLLYTDDDSRQDYTNGDRQRHHDSSRWLSVV
jgi:hypothetical protein